MSDTEDGTNVTAPLPVLCLGKGDPFYKHTPFCLAVKGCGFNIYVRDENKIDDLASILKHGPFPEPPEGVDAVMWKAHRKEERDQIEELG